MVNPFGAFFFDLTPINVKREHFTTTGHLPNIGTIKKQWVKKISRYISLIDDYI